MSRTEHGRWTRGSTVNSRRWTWPRSRTTAAQVSKRIQKLYKEFKGTNQPWKVLDDLRENRVEGIKKLMPLIMDLRNEAMRDRHWKGLMEEVGKTFDPHADTFTLELVLDLGLEHHQEVGLGESSLSTAAGKELAIEEALVKIEAQWESWGST